MRPKVLSMMDIAACPDVLKPLEEVAEVVRLPASQQLLVERIREFDAFATSLAVRSDREVLERAARLRAIATPSTGLDHIDLALAAKKNVAIISLKDDVEFLQKVTATAELAWGLLLSVARRLPTAMAAARSGHWARDEFRGTQLAGKTLGIVGCGRLGTMLARYGRSFGMNVLVCDIKEVSTLTEVKQTDFDTLLRNSDVVSIHVHLTETTRGLFDERAIQAMRPGAILINTSRGGVIDEMALLTALATGHLAGAGLDVIDGEWRSDLETHPLIRYANNHDNLLITPHIGGVTWESQSMAFEHMISKLIEFFQSSGDLN